jgi:hypothetical protein
MVMQGNQRSRWCLIVVAVGLMVTIGATSAWADREVDQIRVQRGKQLRQDLERVVVEYQEIIKFVPVQPEIAALLEDARDHLAKVPDRDLEAFAPELEASVAQLRTAASAFRAAVSGRYDSPVLKTSGLPGAAYPTVNWSFFIDSFSSTNDIPDNAGNTSVTDWCTVASNPTPAQLFSFLNIDIAAEALRDTADRLCSFIGSFAVGGGNLSLICIVSDLVYMVQKSIKENWFLCGAVMGEAELRATFERVGHVHNDLATAKANLSGDLTTAKTAVLAELAQNMGLIWDLDGDLVAHDLKLTEKAAQVDAAIDAHYDALVDFRRQSLRHHIEQRLSEADHGAVALFFLPEFAGGYLETVRDIVDETIAKAAAAGHNVRQARDLFSAGDDDLIAHDFKQAFDLYGRAYRSALK